MAKNNDCIYIALNKPKGFVSATKDNLHPSILELIDDNIKKQYKNLHIVGRLDKDTTGLILITNDGQLTHSLTHPKKEVNKTYLVSLAKEVDKTICSQVEQLEFIDYGKTKIKKPLCEFVNNNTIKISVVEGKFHEVKKIVFNVDNEVKELHRISISKLNLDSLNLKLGEYQMVKKEKIV